jgi:protein-S-isoprenylcysteine O-methyltransferase Ste14
MPLRPPTPSVPSVGGMDLPLILIAVVVVVAAFVLRVVVRRKAQERAEREPQVPTTGRAVGAAVFGLVMIGIGIAILVTADDLGAGTGTRRLSWLPAWIQVVALVAFGAYFLFLATKTLRGVRERRRRGPDAPAFDPLARDADVHDETRP